MTDVVFWRTTPGQRRRLALHGSALGALFLGLPEPFDPWWLPALVGALTGAPIGYLIAPPQYTRLMDAQLQHVQKDNNLSTTLDKLTSVRREFVPYTDPNILLMFGQRRVPITTGLSSSVTTEVKRLWTMPRAFERPDGHRGIANQLLGIRVRECSMRKVK